MGFKLFASAALLVGGGIWLLAFGMASAMWSGDSPSATPWWMWPVTLAGPFVCAALIVGVWRE